ncbi:transcription repressor OFP14-like [Gossypium arboreum]|uniref:transcription repressor OFP14-like n=1 Tax=Gossypium arboreum TaxID=29729 RepID=UPI0022F1D8D7|nr:transcription repressor OFP14-like [Gossypium arboreum]
MSKKLQKSLQDYVSKIKKTSPNIQFLPPNSLSSSKKWIRCKHTKTLSFAVNLAENHGHQGNSDDNNDVAATLADVDRFLFENFKSLYIEDYGEIHEKRSDVRLEDDEVKGTRGIFFDSPRFIDLPSDLCGSNRFFVSTGSSGSLVDEARSSAGTKSRSEELGSTSKSSASIDNTTAANGSNSNGTIGGDGVTVKSLSNIPNECIAVLTYSPNPYDDFRRSMQDMVETRLKHNSDIDWDFMEELVFCYLNLNDKKCYKFILNAFVDLVVDLRQHDIKVPMKARNNVRDHQRSMRTRHNIRLTRK